MRLLASQLRGPGPLVMVASATAEQRRAQIPILWPRYVNGHVRMMEIPPERIPAGWQSVQIHVPMRLATCEETDCPLFLRGWTEVGSHNGNRHAREGDLTADEAAAIFGYFGPASLPPEVTAHPPGTPCPEIHKVPSGTPPLYTVNGRTVLWNEFEDAIGGGLRHAAKISKEGRY